MTDARGLAAGGWIDISVPLRRWHPDLRGRPDVRPDARRLDQGWRSEQHRQA